MEQGIKIDTIGGGALAEKFDVELERILENILDPNTASNAVREMNLKIKFCPTANRTLGSLKIESSSKLAPDVSYVTQAFFGQVNGKFVCNEHNPNQVTMEEFIRGQAAQIDPGVDDA